ncbi:hypothetical protein APV28_4408 [Comamonas testosteroni]|nr:hypothetical protein APV28_4408 [Comamonas testosteroni]
MITDYFSHTNSQSDTNRKVIRHTASPRTEAIRINDLSHIRGISPFRLD